MFSLKPDFGRKENFAEKNSKQVAKLKAQEILIYGSCTKIYTLLKLSEERLN